VNIRANNFQFNCFDKKTKIQLSSKKKITVLSIISGVEEINCIEW